MSDTTHISNRYRKEEALVMSIASRDGFQWNPYSNSPISLAAKRLLNKRLLYKAAHVKKPLIVLRKREWVAS